MSHGAVGCSLVMPRGNGWALTTTHYHFRVANRLLAAVSWYSRTNRADISVKKKIVAQDHLWEAISNIA
jgi:hypothetical protein